MSSMILCSKMRTSFALVCMVILQVLESIGCTSQPWISASCESSRRRASGSWQKPFSISWAEVVVRHRSKDLGAASFHLKISSKPYIGWVSSSNMSNSA